MIVYLDFETYFGPKYSLSTLNTTTYVRDDRFKVWQLGIQIDDGPINILNGPHDEDEHNYISEYLNKIDWANATLVCHNMLFDGFILSQRYNIVPKLYCDTLSMARALHFWGDHDLATIDKLYGGPGKKDNSALMALRGVRNPTEEQYSNLAIYTRGDIEALHRVFNSMLPKFPTKELEIIDLTVRLATEPVLMVDHNAAREVLKAEQDRKQAQLDKIGVTAKQLNSPIQFAELLRERGVEPPTKINAKGETKTAFSKQDSQFLALMGDARVGDLVRTKLDVGSNIVEKRTQRLIDAQQPGWYLPAPLNYWGAITGRWTGADKLNMQNLPKFGGIRNCVIAPNGCVLVVADSSQIECRFQGWFSKQENLLGAFRAKQDVYCEFGTTLYGFQITKADEVLRFISKCAVLGLGYGMGTDRFYLDVLNKSEQYGIDIGDFNYDTADRAKKVFRSLYGNIPGMWSNCDRWINILPLKDYTDEWMCCSFGQERVYLPNGLTIHYPGIQPDGTFNHGRIYGSHFFENLMQCLARIAISEQMLNISKELKVVMTTHDEIVACVPEAQAEDALAFMIDEMSKAPNWCPDMPFAAEGKFARYYSK